ncbi:hypothetical protein ACFX12_022716 [Malus domestica]
MKSTIAGESILTFPFASLTTLYNTYFDSSSTSDILLPMNLFTENKVFLGFTTAYRLAIWPTSLSLFFVYATTNGVVLCLSALVTMVGFLIHLPSQTMATESQEAHCDGSNSR